MEPMTMAAIGAGLGLAKGFIDGPKEQREARLRAEQIRMSPWISVPLQEVHHADPLGNAMQGGVTGFAQGQKMQDSQDAKDFNKKYLDILSNRPNVTASMAPMPQVPSLQGGYFGADAPAVPSNAHTWTLL